MEIKILAQITSDGFIARRDGKRDWYLDPDIYGISGFFTSAAAVLDYEDGRCQVKLKSGESFRCDEPELSLVQLESGPGYVAVEATSHTLPLIQILMSCGLVAELHLIRIPAHLTEGIYSPALLEMESTWTQVEEKKIDRSCEISYTVFRCPETKKKETA